MSFKSHLQNMQYWEKMKMLCRYISQKWYSANSLAYASNFFFIISYIKWDHTLYLFYYLPTCIKLYIYYFNLFPSFNNMLWLSFHIIKFASTALFLIHIWVLNTNEHVCFLQCFAFINYDSETLCTPIVLNFVGQISKSGISGSHEWCDN